MKGIAGVLAAVALLLVVREFVGAKLREMLQSAGAPVNCIQFVGSTTSEENGVNYVVGSVRSSCDRTYSSVTISFLADRQNSASAPRNSELSPAPFFAYVRNLKPGATEEFRSALPVSRSVSYRFEAISAF